MYEPYVSVQMDRKVNLGNFEMASVSITVSRIPLGSSAEYIAEAAETGELCVSVLNEIIEGRIKDRLGKVAPGFAFDFGRAAAPADEPDGLEGSALAQLDEPHKEPAIPSAAEITQGWPTAFNLKVDPGEPMWSTESIGADQMKALNTLLGVHGYKDKARHKALNTLLAEFGSPKKIDSLYKLTRAEAHVLLGWFRAAEADGIAIAALSVHTK